MDDQERGANREELFRELVRVMSREPKTPRGEKKQIERARKLHAQIDELRHAGDK